MGPEAPKSPILAPLVQWAPPLFLLLRSPVPAAMDVAANPSKGQRARTTHAVPGTRCSHHRGQAAPSSQETRPLAEPRVQELKPRVLLFTLHRVFLGA